MKRIRWTGWAALGALLIAAPLWGAPAPRSWFEEASLLDGAKIAEAALKAQPIVAP